MGVTGLHRALYNQPQPRYEWENKQNNKLGLLLARKHTKAFLSAGATAQKADAPPQQWGRAIDCPGSKPHPLARQAHLQAAFPEE